jgi:hypothetical protein
MKAQSLRSRPSWRTSESRPVRPEVWLVAVVAIGMLLIEVWQSSRVAELSLHLDQVRSALADTRVHVDYLRADGERLFTRAELGPAARRLGLAPARPQQMVAIPAAYVAETGTAERRFRPPSLWTMAERASRVLVPEATARDRIGD